MLRGHWGAAAVTCARWAAAACRTQSPPAAARPSITSTRHSATCSAHRWHNGGPVRPDSPGAERPGPRHRASIRDPETSDQQGELRAADLPARPPSAPRPPNLKFSSMSASLPSPGPGLRHPGGQHAGKGAAGGQRRARQVGGGPGAAVGGARDGGPAHRRHLWLCHGPALLSLWRDSGE